jgi:hypothetical protein
MLDYCFRHILEIITAMFAGLVVILRSLNITRGLQNIDSEIRENKKILQTLTLEVQTLKNTIERLKDEKNKHY